jgi:hypothetical protein
MSFRREHIKTEYEVNILSDSRNCSVYIEMDLNQRCSAKAESFHPFGHIGVAAVQRNPTPKNWCSTHSR